MQDNYIRGLSLSKLNQPVFTTSDCPKAAFVLQRNGFCLSDSYTGSMSWGYDAITVQTVSGFDILYLYATMNTVILNSRRKIMSGKERGMSRKSNLLDKLFGNKKRAILVALVAAVIGYLLFLMFGDIHATEDALYRPVVMGIFAFVAMFLVLGFQLINPFCSANAMDIAELFFALFVGVGFAFWLVMYGIWMLFGNDAYQAATMIAQVSGMWCALCLIHNMRK